MRENYKGQRFLHFLIMTRIYTEGKKFSNILWGIHSLVEIGLLIS